MSADRTLAARISGYLHEASVLIVVFGLLDPMVQGDAASAHTLSGRIESLPVSWAIFIVGLSLALFAAGVSVESRRFRGTQGSSG